MATKNSQRIGIWIIAGVLLIGTLGSFVALMLGPKNQQIDAVATEQKTAAAQKEQQAAAEESAKAAEPLDGYATESFDPTSIKELKKEILVEGSGQVVTASDTINVSYFGWLSDGKIFDSSKRSGANAPIDLPLNGVIAGWTEGLTGAKVGSTIKLIIPADKAYGSQAAGIIPANSPLAFILTINSVTKAKN